MTKKLTVTLGDLLNTKVEKKMNVKEQLEKLFSKLTPDEKKSVAAIRKETARHFDQRTPDLSGPERSTSTKNDSWKVRDQVSAATANAADEEMATLAREISRLEKLPLADAQMIAAKAMRKMPGLGVAPITVGQADMVARARASLRDRDR